MTRAKFKAVRERLYAIIQDSVESGTRALVSWSDFHDENGSGFAFWASKDCGCLLWVVSGDSCGMHGYAAKKLGISIEEARLLETGFEGFKDGIPDAEKESDFYKLGQEVRKNYVEYQS